MTTPALDIQAADLEKLNNLFNYTNLLTRMQKNIALLGNADNSTLIRVSNPNLYQLAAQYYGDWTQWETIANANNLTDFIVEGMIDLLIPPQPNSTTTNQQGTLNV